MKIDPKNRRMFLQGAFGMALALPWLPSLVRSRQAKGASDKLIRYVQLVADHHPLSIARHPDFAKTFTHPSTTRTTSGRRCGRWTSST